MDNNEKLNSLLKQLDDISLRQELFAQEIFRLKEEIDNIKRKESLKSEPNVTEEPIINKVCSEQEDNAIFAPPPVVIQEQKAPKQEVIIPETPKYDEGVKKSNIEKFIGENLINKIGIAVTIIGIGIGAKYAIDNKLISPLLRIILAYLAGLGLFGISLKLRSKYLNYSAVLFSGSMATMYFVTYLAYTLYGFIPQIPAFILMLLFTALTVIAAIKYNKQVIAHIGLVGAYALPLLLGSNSGNAAIMFSYMTIINMGILAISIKRYWKPILYSSMSLTWLIFIIWHIFNSENSYADGALIFVTLFFTIFYASIITYKSLKKEKFGAANIILILANSFVFYGLGSSIIDNHFDNNYLGLFTLSNALLHLFAGFIVYKNKAVDRNMFRFIIGLALVFVTITIPVQFDGNWVTLLWICEATLMFTIGKTKNSSVYEKISYAIMALAILSLIHDWSNIPSYAPDIAGTRMSPLLNINFITSVIYILAFGYIIYLQRNSKSQNNISTTLKSITSYGIPATLIVIIYITFRIEIETYFRQLYTDIYTSSEYINRDVIRLRRLWVIIYSVLFVSALGLSNIKLFKNKILGYSTIIISIITLFVFMVQGLYNSSLLRDSYLSLSGEHNAGIINIIIRYIGISTTILLIYTNWLYIKRLNKTAFLMPAFECFIHLSSIWIISSELINIMDILNLGQSYKLTLSILWGTYSLFMIILGIKYQKKHLRIAAIVLFATTLLKLFTYDIAHLNTIAKTIVFVSLGVLLLVISFLYNKYKNKIYK
ncbi:MAG: DUF2339 domain-containing protein [Bacteroidales bacterium]|jgi:uncharacterized membrane protein|nr:DUF2339 domain-containing protein [Bacteroidales bacterium]